MALEKKIFGYLPVNRGKWVSGTTYYQYNEVMNDGSTFIAKHDITNSTVAPTVTYDEQTGVITVTPSDDWDLVSYGGNAVQIAAQIAGKANISDLEDGTIEVAVAHEADELRGNSHARSETVEQFLIRTTAGSLDIDSSKPARLAKLEGILDDDCNPFKPTSFHWSGANLLDPSQKLSNATINGSSIVSGTGNVYYFRVPALKWGTYGSNDENNGILFTNNNHQNVIPAAIVFFTAVPAINGNGYLPLSTTTHNHTYYYNPAAIATEGYIAVQFASGVDAANISAHIAWDNEFDDEYVAFSAGSSISLSWFWNDSRMNSWGMAGIVRGGEVVSDEIVFDEDTTSNRKVYRRIGRALLSGLTWSVTENEGVYTFAANISSSMLSNGLVKLPQSLGAYTVEGTTISFVSSIYSTIDDFKTNVLGSAYVYFQLATVTEVAHSVSGEGTANDMGIEEFIGTDYPTGRAYLSYIISLKYYLESLPDALDNDFDAVVNALAQLWDNYKRLAEKGDNLGCTKAVKLDFELLPSLMGFDWMLYGTAAPVDAPNFSGQFYVDTTNKIAYIACGTTASDWKRITNA